LLLGLFLFAVFFYHAVKRPFLSIILLSIGSYLGEIGKLTDAGIPITVFQFTLLIAILAFIMNRIITSNHKIQFMRIEVSLILLLGLIFLSLIYSENRVDGLLRITRVIVLLFMVYMIVNIITEFNQIKYITYSIIFMGIILGVLAIVQGFNTDDLIVNMLSQGAKLAGRTSGSVQDPNIFATHFFLPINTLIIFFVTKEMSFKKKILTILLLGIVIPALLSTFSRSAWVSVFFSFLLITYLKKSYSIYYQLVVPFVIAILFIPQVQIIAFSIVTRIEDIFLNTNDDSTGIRLVLMQRSFDMFVDSYTFGVGYRDFPLEFIKYQSAFETIGVVEPHNVILTVLAELGIAGIVLFVIIYYKIFKIAILNFKQTSITSRKNIYLTLLITFIAYFIFYQFYNGFFVDNNLWIVIALIFSARKIEEIKNESISNEVDINNV
jgi:O-antigen ligase